MKQNRLKQRGIGLLELMLSLAIIAILLVTATRYYQITRGSEQVTEGIRMLQTTIAGSESWYWTYKSFQPANGPAISIQKLADMGLVPKDFPKPNNNPWGGDIKVDAIDDNHLTIQLTKVAKGDCTNLAEVIRSHGMPAICELSSGTVSVVYAAGKR